MSADTESAPAPVLSIVVAARNDDYGQTFTDRFQTFLRYLASLEERHKALFELVVVEWNPPSGRPPMAEAFDWCGLERVRVFTVPSEVHASIPISGVMPMLEFVAKNVGVRRATAPFVLSTNPDVLLSPGFFDFVAENNLDPKAFYRADRYDLSPEIVFKAPDDDLFDLATQAVFEVHTRNTIDPEEPMSHFIDPSATLDEWPQSQPFYGDTLSDNGAVILGGKRRDPLSGLHTQASGDFMLASKEAWETVRGHWERTDTYTHLDSYLVCHFQAAGYQQRILRRPIMVLHMDHSREVHSSRPIRPYAETLAEIRQAAAGALPNPNDEGWGLANVELPVTRPKKRKSVTGKTTLAELVGDPKALSRVYALAAAQRAEALRTRTALNQQIGDLRALIAERETQRQADQARLDAAERRHAELIDISAAQASRISELEESLSRAAQSSAALQAEINETKQANAEAAAARARAGERVDYLQHRVKQLRAEADEAHAAARNAAESVPPPSEDQSLAELARLIGVARSEELERLAAAYEHRIEVLSRTASEHERLTAQLDEERRLHREIEHAKQQTDRALAHERARRDAAEALLHALEHEGIERESRFGALEQALADAQSALRDAVAEREHAIASFKDIVENSRYLKARRALVQMLKGQ